MSSVNSPSFGVLFLREKVSLCALFQKENYFAPAREAADACARDVGLVCSTREIPFGGRMSNASRYRVNQSRSYDEWLLSVAQALAMLTFSLVIRWMVS
ncbi:MAG: hypothetical protein KA171_10270 [Reyranella sp.]|nr:hypothetical protein [Reyranella sp.]